MGEKQNQPFQLSFNPTLKVDFQGSRVTSDGGLLLVRELDERLGLSELIGEHLTDSRGKNTQLPIGWIRRRERCRASGTRSDLPAHGFGKNLGARSGADVPVAIVRDGAVDPRRESLWAGCDQPQADCPGVLPQLEMERAFLR